MGSPLAPDLANLFLGHHEHSWLSKYKGPSIQFYCRYVDDTFYLFNNEHDASFDFDFLNSQHDNIKFTMEKESNNILAFLDVLINNNAPSNLITLVYRKKTFTGLFSDFLVLPPFRISLALSNHCWIELINLTTLFWVSMRMLRSSLICLERINFLTD